MRITLEEVIKRHKANNPNTNYDYSETVLAKTLHDKVSITCRKHGVFRQAPHEHMKGQGCPKCSHENDSLKKRNGINLFIKKSVEKFDNKFSYGLTCETYTKMKTKCMLHCNIHNINFNVSPYDHLKSKSGGCPCCKNLKTIEKGKNNLEKKKKQENERLERKRTREINKAKREAIKEEAKKKRALKEKEIEKKKLLYIEKHSNEHLLRSFITRANKKHNWKYDYSMINEYHGLHCKVPIICHEKDEDGHEHGIFYQTPSHHMGPYSGCLKCKRPYECTTNGILKQFKKVHGDRYEYPNFEYQNMRAKVDIHCNKCGGNFTQDVKEHIRGIGCPYCRRSKLENDIEQLLKTMKIKFKEQCRKDTLCWLGSLSLDFYLPDYKIAIECQGIQHFKPTEKFGGEEAFKKNSERDKRKLKLCKENNVKLIYYTSKKFKQYTNNIKEPLFFDKNEMINYIKGYY